MKKLHRYVVGEFPLLFEIAERMNLRSILYEYIPKQANEDIPVVEVLILLIYNLTIGKAPLYELDEWVKKINLGAMPPDEFFLTDWSDLRGLLLNSIIIM